MAILLSARISQYSSDLWSCISFADRYKSSGNITSIVSPQSLHHALINMHNVWLWISTQTIMNTHNSAARCSNRLVKMGVYSLCYGLLIAHARILRSNADADLVHSSNLTYADRYYVVSRNNFIVTFPAHTTMQGKAMRSLGIQTFTTAWTRRRKVIVLCLHAQGQKQVQEW